MSIPNKRPDIEIPDYMRSLPMTGKGYLKPWFVKGDDFRIVDGDKARLSVDKKACWICGNPFKPGHYALVGSPDAAMTRTCREPPCHVECAEYAVQVCPFILYPNAKRRAADLPQDATLEHHNEGKAVKLGAENPGKYYIVVISNFVFHEKLQLSLYNESHVIERQYWIGGERQASIPDPIVPLETLPEKLQKHYHNTNK